MNVDVYAVCYDLHYRLHKTYDTVLRSAIVKNNHAPLMCTGEDTHSRIENDEIVRVIFESVVFEQNQVQVRALKKFTDGSTLHCAYPLYMLTLEEILIVMKEII